MPDPKQTAQDLGGVFVPDPQDTAQRLGGTFVPDATPEGDELSRAVRNNPTGHNNLLTHREQQNENAKRFVRELGTKNNPIDMIKGLYGAVTDPIGTVKNIYGQQADLANKSYQSFRQGQPLVGVRQGLESLIPLLGPQAEEAASKMGTPEGNADFVSLVGQLLGAKGAGERVASKINYLRDPETQFLSKTQPAIATYAPRNAIKLQNDMRRAIPLVQEVDPNVKVNLLDARGDTLSPAIGKAINKIDTQFEPYLQRADTYGVTADGNKIADHILASIPEKFKTFNPGGYQNLVDSLIPYRKQFSPRLLRDFQATTNAQLSRFYEGLPAQVNDTLASNAHMASLESEADALRDNVYRTLDPEHDGADAAELMQRRGSLMDVRDEHTKLINKTLKTAQPNLMEKLVGSAGTIIRGPKALAAAKLAAPDTASQTLENAFRYKMEPLRTITPVPTTYPRNPLQIGPGPTRFPNPPGVQYNPHTGQFTGSPSYGVSITRGEPVTGTMPPSRQIAPSPLVGPPLELRMQRPNIPEGEPPLEFQKQRSTEEEPMGQGIMFHNIPTPPAPEMHDIPSRTFSPTYNKYPWHDIGEEPPMTPDPMVQLLSILRYRAEGNK